MRKMLTGIAAVLVSGAALMLASPAAMAHSGVNWSVNIGAPVAVYGPPPVVYAPPPAVYAPPPVVYARPQPVYVEPAPVVGYGRVYYGAPYYRPWHGHGHWRHHRY